MPEQHVMDTGMGQAWLDGELSPIERARAQAHVASCRACQAALVEWLGVRACLEAYEPPPEAPGAAWRFWHRLAPQLPERRPAPDLAPYLTPIALAVAYGLWQGLAEVVALLAGLARSGVLAPVWHQVTSSGWLAALARELGAGAWWSAIPAPTQPGLWGLVAGAAIVAVRWWGAIILSGLLMTWLYLWLQRPHPAPEAAPAE